MGKLSHIDTDGRAAMVDVSDKAITKRTARASGKVTMRPETAALVREHQTPKGDPLETARLAGIMAAKKTGDLIPLCHPLPIEHVDVSAKLVSSGVELEASIVTTSKTGAEMEALTAVCVAALTIYDMCKAVDREIRIEAICLEEKEGGKSGHFVRGKS
jgi:cyclic pyranopterin monophosphate synthase